MSRWGRNIVVPLDSLCKEKENTNRPTVARSVGTVGKWGKMGFTSTRTYALAALPDMSPSIPEPPKPKKFFKSVNTTPPEVIAQIIQQLPRVTPTSPTGEHSSHISSAAKPISTHATGNSKQKVPKKKSTTQTKAAKITKTTSIKSSDEQMSDTSETNGAHLEAKSTKKVKKKPLKPEAPPSRVLGRARKAVNYCEDDEDMRGPTPMRDIIIPKPKEPRTHSTEILSPALQPVAVMSAPKVPEHRPIVLRISKGTSRLVDTDNDDDTANTSSPSHSADINSSHDTTVKPPKKIDTEPAVLHTVTATNDEPPEINYSSVKISPDKPPKERLKLIIKTDVIKNAIAAAAAAAATVSKQPSNSAATTIITTVTGADNEIEQQQQLQLVQRPDKERKKSKHKHKLKIQQQQENSNILTPPICEFKAPSPNVVSVLGTNGETLTPASTILSPAGLSERDFDSQSSVLGSISSKGNSTPHQIAHTCVQEDNYVVHSRGSSVITSDLETSQHSSLVAPPSDIELRLESMMMDGSDTGGASRAATIGADEPLQEDILSVLRGEEESQASAQMPLINGNQVQQTIECEPQQQMEEQGQQEKISKRRVTRGRGRAAAKNEDEQKQTRHMSNRKTEVLDSAIVEETTISNRRRQNKIKTDEMIGSPAKVLETAELNAAAISTVDNVEQETMQIESDTPKTIEVTTRRGRPARSTRNNSCNYNNHNNNNNNNNINKIAANLSAKAEAQVIGSSAESGNTALPSTPRHYGRKRKNQQVTQVLQPSPEELKQQPHAAKKATTIDSLNEVQETTTRTAMDSNNSLSTNSNSPPRHDYKVKDKFKRTIMLDNNQGNCDAVVASPATNYHGDYQPNEVAAGQSGDDQYQLQQQQQRGSVKLVISKKKGSIFKSRTLVPSDPMEPPGASKRHLYKHSWNPESNETPSGRDTPNSSTNDMQANTNMDDLYNDFDGNNEMVQTENTDAVSLGHAYNMDIDDPSNADNMGANAAQFAGMVGSNKRKGFYTVVRNVKTAHQIQEIGEYQEMNDDVQYILDALQPHNPMSTRVLSALQLASKCMNSAFRMHVRSHDVVTKFFRALSDANKDLSLGLCTSAIMYILSQEGLNMDLDRDSLELMMNLLKAENVATPAEYATYERNKQKVRELCEEIKAQGKATHLNVDSITVGTLAMETLLSLTSKRAGDWFKEELRELGGLEHIIKTISECCRPVIKLFEIMPSVTWTGVLMDNMKTAERCMRVLENVTQMNEKNQKYILTYEEGVVLQTLATLFRLCERELLQQAKEDSTHEQQAGVVLRELLMPLTKVLINLTHSFHKGSTMGADVLGQRVDVFNTCFQLLLKTHKYIPDRFVFELNILVLLLLINLTMYSLTNRARVMQAQVPALDDSDNCLNNESTVSAMQALMEYFYKCEELARLVEKNTDAMLDNTDKDKKKIEEVDETVNNLIQKAGHHMEHTLKGSYAGILMGHIIKDNEENEMNVRSFLHGNGFKEIVNVLEKYHTFMNLTASSDAFTVAHIKSTKTLIDYYKRRDLIYAETANENIPLNLETQHTPSTSTTRLAEDNIASTSMAGPAVAASNTTATTTRGGVQRVYKTYSSQR